MNDQQLSDTAAALLADRLRDFPDIDLDDNTTRLALAGIHAELRLQRQTHNCRCPAHLTVLDGNDLYCDLPNGHNKDHRWT